MNPFYLYSNILFEKHFKELLDLIVTRDYYMLFNIIYM